MTTVVIVAAGGKGTRLGPGVPKALRPLRGEPIVVHVVRALVSAPSVSHIVVAAPPDDVELVRQVLEPVTGGRVGLSVVAGGDDRVDSVDRALAELPAQFDVVLVHDAARALVPAELVERVARTVRDGAAAVIPVVGLADTVKRVGPDGSVTETLDRSTLRAVQTPQGFQRSVLIAAHQAARSARERPRGGSDEIGPTVPPTDDAALVERIGVAVRTIPGSEEAFKVTRPLDVLFAEAILDLRATEADR